MAASTLSKSSNQAPAARLTATTRKSRTNRSRNECQFSHHRRADPLLTTPTYAVLPMANNLFQVTKTNIYFARSSLTGWAQSATVRVTIHTAKNNLPSSRRIPPHDPDSLSGVHEHWPAYGL